MSRAKRIAREMAQAVDPENPERLRKVFVTAIKEAGAKAKARGITKPGFFFAKDPLEWSEEERDGYIVYLKERQGPRIVLDTGRRPMWWSAPRRYQPWETG